MKNDVINRPKRLIRNDLFVRVFIIDELITFV